jgi:hypothetical protein
MAYSTSAPPQLIAQSVGGGGALWFYSSADAIATVNTSGYFTNGYRLGMKVGDSIIVRDTATPTQTLAVVMDVNTTTGAADISDGTTISVTDSD